MVKSNAPLQIRLTEPVIFLRGPSTGLDFRGRPQVVRDDGQPAMLRGLLTVRLAKPTRIRTISIQLAGKARTEWPEGIGLRRMDTHEEHTIMSESTTYFSSRDESASHSRSTRRAASLGPGISLSQWDLDDDELDEAIDLHDVPAEGENLGEWVGVSRRGRDHTLRSASALPMTHDGTSWYRDGFSRRPSFSDEVDPLANGVRDLAPFSSHERGPSPAYTPVPDPLLAEPRRSSLRRSHSPRPSREPGLSPIHSAPASRAASERDDNSETANRRPSLAMRNGLPGEALTEDALWRPEAPADMASESEVDEDAAGPVAPGPARPILEGGGHRVASGEVRFAQNVRGGMSSGRVEPHLSSSPEALPPTNRAASIRTMNSAFSESSTSLTSSSQEHSGGETHPVVAVVQPISAASTSGNLPTPSTAPSIQARASTETFPRASMSSNSSTGGGLHSYYDLVTPPSGSSRRSSLLSRGVSRPLVGGDTSLSPGSISDTSPEVTQGRKSRLCSASTIVRNGGNDSTPSSSIPTIPRAQREDSAFSPQPASDSLSPSSRVSKQRGNGSATLSREPSEDGRGRNKSKFNLSAALRGLSKGRISSTSRTRADKSRTPSFIEPPPPVPSVSMAMARGASGSAVPPRLFDGQPTSRQTRAESFGQADEFVAPYGRSGAGSRNASMRRTDSPSRGQAERSESRGRGRNKVMKKLTGALGFSGDVEEEEEEEEDLHDWKEFRRGTYNYPISFPIPVNTPPTIHAEFGSVTYRLKATVVRVGALTPNLVEDVEVSMIASPQEDDLEESENVVVERQWEEQMRYQIALSGKTFPIGGTIPVSIRLMPLTKCKIHRLTILLEEKSDYYAQDRKIARHETPKKFLMLFVKQIERLERIQPLLPIISDDPEAARDSPLAPLALQAALNNPTVDSYDVDGHNDNMYATLLDPMGPWHLEKNLTVPDCSSTIRFTTKHEKTNINIAHWLKVTIRVERGDDDAVNSKGRRKQFDIIIDTPIKILDCRVNPQWNSLPTYSAAHSGSTTSPRNICSVHASKHLAPLVPNRKTPIAAPDPLVTSSSPPISRPSLSRANSGRESSTSRSRERAMSDATIARGREGPVVEDTLLERNIVYDRLMSGQMTETGEVPPSYGDAVASGNSARARSASRVGRGIERDLREENGSRSRSRLRQSVVA